MKLSKKEEAAVLKAYKSYWDGYVSGDVKNMAKLLDSNYTQVGSAEAEVFSNKKDAVKFLHDTIDQVAGKAEIRNQSINLEYLEDYVLVNDLFDIYVLTDGEWVYYAKLRASTLMSEDKGKWKFIHQHSSVPDIRTEDGENIATDKIAKENLQLRDAIKRRTVELESKNRELEIETALERVRARALAMHSSNELLPVTAELRRQIDSLGQLDLEASVIHLYEKESEWFEAFAAVLPPGDDGEIKTYQILLPVDVTAEVKKMMNKYWSNETEYTIELTPQKSNEWQQVMQKHAPQLAKGRAKFAKKVKNTDQSQFWNFADFSGGSLLLVTHSHLSAEAASLLRRSADVFDLAYRRFKDLQKTEAQAREAQIEVALERVRARSMAMHKSEELPQVALTVLNQIESLDIEHISCNINIVNNDTKNFVSYGATFIEDNDQKISDQLPQLNLHDIGFLRKALKLMKSGDTNYTIELKGKFLDEMMKIWKASNYSGINNKYIQNNPKVLYLSWAVFNGFSSIGLTSIDPLTDEQLAILVRFAKVFQQTYTRFLDLHKAEEQAREAQIEAALERVRAMTMGMHNSSELLKVVDLLYLELSQLEVELARIVLLTINPQTLGMHWWMANPEMNIKARGYLVPHNNLPITLSMIDAWKNKLSDWWFDLKGNEKRLYDKFLFSKSELSQLPVEVQDAMASLKQIYISGYCNNFGILTTSTLTPISSANATLLARFGKVFDQTYSRFLDLQKAEAQAREVEIELALERVRARTMAMQKSEELKEVVAVQYEQMGLLDMADWASNIIIMDEPKKSYELWLSIAEQNILPESYTLDIKGHKLLKEQWKIWQNQLEGRHIHLEGQAKKEYDKYVLNDTDLIRLPVKVKKAIKSISEMYVSMASMKCGLIASFNFNAPLSKSEFQILQRFAKVFDQTYTRFLDLQKAEAQAREAQIEVALERVRARSLAMHKSDELSEVIGLVFQQFIKLGIRLHNANFVVGDAKDWAKTNRTFWVAGLEISHPFKILMPYIDHPMFNRVIQGAKKGSDFLEDTFEFEEKNSYFRHWFNKGIRENRNLAAEKKVFKSPGYARSVAFFNDIELAIGKFEPVPFSSEENIILRRFAKVFEQTYTRFLDLQKAEAQAREAKIEAALERVRAATMAMHKSADLHKVVLLVLSQMEALDINMSSALIHEFREPLKDQYFWIAAGGITYPDVIHLPYIQNQFFTRFEKARNKSESFFSDEFSKTEKNKLWKYSFTYSPVPKKRQQFVLSSPGLCRSTALFENTAITILRYDKIPFKEEENSVLMRFGQVFQQTYTRFLDLQKAEEQAREAQIETALERVRAITMAMHKSKDLSTAITTVFSQLIELNFTTIRCGIGIFNDRTRRVDAWTASEGEENNTAKLSGDEILEGHPLLEGIFDAWENQQEYSYVLEGDDLKEYYNVTANSNLPVSGPKGNVDNVTQYYHCVMFPAGGLFAFKDKPFTDEEKILMRRFADVFHLTFIRHLDLMQAEAQAREAQIETALERIRAKALAMHSSEELMDVAQVLREQMGALGQSELIGSVVHLYPENSEFFNSSYSFRPEQKGRKVVTGSTLFRKNATSLTRKWLKFYHSDANEYTIKISGAELKEWVKVRNKKVPFFATNKTSKQPSTAFFHGSDFSGGSLIMSSHEEPSQEAKDLQRRAASVFDLAYRRFLDLQKAEEQAREAQVEAALERVRAKSMAMHNSEDIGKTVSTLFDELLKVGIHKSSRSGIGILNETKNMKLWSALSNAVDEVDLLIGNLDMTINPLLKKIKNAWKKQDGQFYYELEGKELSDYYASLNQSQSYSLRTDLNKLPEKEFIHVFTFKHGIIYSFNSVPISEEANQVFKRFAKVFEQTYTRFLDLQKAEAQAREAQIEAALERVRSQTMAMHNSQDVDSAVLTLFEEILRLNVDESIRCGIAILSKSDDNELWSASFDVNNKLNLYTGKINPNVHPLLKGAMKAWEEKKQRYDYKLSGKEVIAYYKILNDAKDYSFQVDLASLPNELFNNSFIFSEGLLFAFTAQPKPAEAIQVLSRFAAVFEQTYTRFLDLQKAEEQAREAQIEAALERVRARSMAMHKTDELKQVIDVISAQFEILDIPQDVCLINIFGDETNKDWNFWIATYPDQVNVPYFRHPIFTQLASARQNDLGFYTQDLNRKDKDRFFDHFYKNAEGVKVVQKRRNFISKAPGWTFSVTLSKFASIHLANYRSKPYTDEENQILQRIGNAFEQTYTRFLELKKAEAREVEAIKQSSLDRVRAEIASMRTANDLNRITPLVWQELTTLGVPFFRCGVFIMDIKAELAHAYLSTPSGSSLTALELKFDAFPLVAGAFKHWQKQKVYIEEWDKKQFIKWTKPLVEQGQVDSRKKYQGGEDAPNHLVLQLVPFKQGMLYVGSAEKLANNQIELVKSIADAFSVAYARYEDFIQLEEAKGRIENTLSELKSTQTQLIQSEKMASLGELTAGIAHEIQNPLNFVNNFSEVSSELVDEISEEIKAGNMDEVEYITTDLKQNLEKINHHGQRASGIVKGMLEHSRTGSSEKELTDINKLADEYLRLSYHGLRAKDKSFNADFKTNFDESLPKVKVITQDLGRVILNLINNAFYAVSSKSEAGSRDYKPTVTVSTVANKSPSGDLGVEISVKDNGAGIPEDIKDKIFQPFFTTKPTGSGTGLGLSMSYDIITKGHDGELRVESKEGVGSEFVIKLPLA